MSYRRFIHNQREANRVDFMHLRSCDQCYRRFDRDLLIADHRGSLYCEDCADDAGTRRFA